MKRKILLAFMALATSFSLVSCGDDDKDDDPKPKGGGDIENSAFSIKYETGDDSYEIFTISADRNQLRLDFFYEDETWFDETEAELDEPRSVIDHWVYLNTDEGYFEYYDGEWEESFQAAQSCNNYYAEHKDLSKYYVQYSNFTEAGTETICGVTCTKYVGVESDDQNIGLYSEFMMSGAKNEIVVGSGFTFRLAEEDWIDENTKGMDDVLKAVALTTDVPDKAFTKTLDVTWIK